LNDDQARDGLLKGFAYANHEIYVTSLQQEKLAGMGTTLTAMAVAGSSLYFAHVGDSRGYLFRDNQLVQLTEDHSLVNEHVKAGLISPEQAKVSYFRNIITRSVGTEETLVVDSFAVEIFPGDIFLLCSDGLVNLVEDEEIGMILGDTPPDKTSQALVDLANQRGGDDNISVMAIYAYDAPRQKEK
jgi:protein phosphatase